MFNKLISFLAVSLFLITKVSSASSESLGSIAVEPIDYDTYGETIDLRLVRYLDDGTVFFYTKDATTVNNETRTFRNATILENGQLTNTFSTGDTPIYLYVDQTSGVVSITDDDSLANGIFYIDSYIFFDYHSVFVACQEDDSATNYTLIWRGASSPAVCENDWLLVYLKAYGSTSSSVSEYFPNGYDSSIGATATQNTDTSTLTTAIPATSSSSTNLAAGGGASSAYVYSGLSALVVAALAFLG